jgi:hypothetical protein
MLVLKKWSTLTEVVMDASAINKSDEGSGNSSAETQTVDRARNTPVTHLNQPNLPNEIIFQILEHAVVDALCSYPVKQWFSTKCSHGVHPSGNLKSPLRDLLLVNSTVSREVKRAEARWPDYKLQQNHAHWCYQCMTYAEAKSYAMQTPWIRHVYVLQGI